MDEIIHYIVMQGKGIKHIVLQILRTASSKNIRQKII